MNNRVKEKLTQKINNILDNKFIVDDIEILLLNIRDYARANQYNLLLEFGDFIAHPDREKGIVYEELDCQYSKFKYMETSNGENLNYQEIPKDVYNLLFNKSIDLMSDFFLINELQMNATQLKNYIQQKLVTRSGKNFSVVDDSAKNRLKQIQKVLNKKPPELHEMTESRLFDELETCLKMLSNDMNISFETKKFRASQENLLLCLLDIIKDCKIKLHDGELAKGYLTVGNNNSVFTKNPSISNLNLCFSGEIPVQQSTIIFELIQTRLLVGKYIPEPDTTIEWYNIEKTHGKMKTFYLSKQGSTTVNNL